MCRWTLCREISKRCAVSLIKPGIPSFMAVIKACRISRDRLVCPSCWHMDCKLSGRVRAYSVNFHGCQCKPGTGCLNLNFSAARRRIPLQAAGKTLEALKRRPKVNPESSSIPDAIGVESGSGRSCRSTRGLPLVELPRQRPRRGKPDSGWLYRLLGARALGQRTNDCLPIAVRNLTDKGSDPQCRE
jgi:hypothetical protein